MEEFPLKTPMAGVQSWEKFLEKMEKKGLRPDGSEIVDPKPMEPPIGYTSQPSMIELMRSMMNEAFRKRMEEEEGFESLEESDDFDMDDEGAPLSGYEDERELEDPNWHVGSRGSGRVLPKTDVSDMSADELREAYQKALEREERARGPSASGGEDDAGRPPGSPPAKPAVAPEAQENRPPPGGGSGPAERRGATRPIPGGRIPGL